MTPTAILLITLSVVAHAGWNLRSKRRPSLAFFSIASTTSALLLTPLLWYERTMLGWVPATVWALVGVTGLFQAVYYTGVAGAYRHGDMSRAYPLLRALPVLLITGISFILGRGEQITSLALAGIIAVVAGCLLLPIRDFGKLNGRDYLALCCLLALMAAVGTTGYTLTDDEALRQLRAGIPWMDRTRIALFYIVLQTLSTSLWVALLVLLWPTERNRWRHIWRDGRWQAAGTGLIITGAYGLVLASMAYVTNVSYVAAFRQMSIPLGAVLGMTLLHEPRHFPKLIGVGMVVAGLILVALF